ncbi:DEAD/DEAH box helicase [Chryseobacterium sp. SG20098]|uniref:DEAD/DEAH box helicase n=1 Tax=Chryseobacterium sp. SG20098 TaxID=3074145 RepID=UPI002883158A|nr:DEAD/DEAH box helicase [Chryseobacterium sp. SG20098]WNI37070.1 DEAD/DEAH box helicase family protein [Chryseobacterium sp. SG20098]
MNTGAGKTLVGLLMLHSKMIETRERSLYLCPDKQLVSQVIEQSRHYNIPTCFMADGDSDFPEDFLNKKSILITTVQKLFNGKNIFDKDRIAVGSILFDDAHKCVEKVFDQYTIRINKNLAAYSELLTLFEEEIKKQESGSYEGILSGVSDYFIKLPFWSWNNKRDEVINILKSYIANPDVLLFKWDLFINDYSKYELYFDSYHIEISPIKCNTKRIQTYYKA